mmetsp:Transcript_8303/g.21786  ORF Transcript_8303/g.21786 Transcript_8303/m.21786 type:complete len:223 (-) Transcript_8303:247-915(-)
MRPNAPERTHRTSGAPRTHLKALPHFIKRARTARKQAPPMTLRERLSKWIQRRSTSLRTPLPEEGRAKISCFATTQCCTRRCAVEENVMVLLTQLAQTAGDVLQATRLKTNAKARHKSCHATCRMRMTSTSRFLALSTRATMTAEGRTKTTKSTMTPKEAILITAMSTKLTSSPWRRVLGHTALRLPLLHLMMSPKFSSRKTSWTYTRNESSLASPCAVQSK